MLPIVKVRASAALLAVLALLTGSQSAAAAEATPPVAASPSFFHHLLVSNGIIFGPLMLLLAVSLFGLMLYLAVALRHGKAVIGPADAGDQLAALRHWAPQEQALRWLGGLGLLGPMLGLLGTLLGVIFLGMEVGRSGATVSEGMMLVGMSHAFSVLFEGIFLACLAVPAYIVFKNRLQRLMLATVPAGDLSAN